MTLRDFAAKTSRIATEHGLAAAASAAGEEVVAKSLLRPYVAARQRRLRQQVPAQIDLLDELRSRDQYTLLVFDTGRYDYMAPLLRDAFEGEVRQTFSHARDTFEWASKTWLGDYDDVTYITGMVPVSDEIPDFDAEDFRLRYDGINPGDSIGQIVKLWETHWDSTVATVPPETVTDVALDYASADKLVVHYAQPHSPYIGTPQLLGHSETTSAEPKQGRPNDEPIWERVRTGDVSDAYLRAAYLGNAVRAIEAVTPLVQERDTVVATADHGEALGEYGMYTHDRSPHPKRRSVPWMEIDGLCEREYSEKEMDVTDRLEALGYR